MISQIWLHSLTINSREWLRDALDHKTRTWRGCRLVNKTQTSNEHNFRFSSKFHYIIEFLSISEFGNDNYKGQLTKLYLIFSQYSVSASITGMLNCLQVRGGGVGVGGIICFASHAIILSLWSYEQKKWSDKWAIDSMTNENALS